MTRDKIIVGEKYRIRRNLRDIRVTSRTPGINSDMELLEGEGVTVTSACVVNNSWFRVKENEWSWHCEWFEPIEPEVEYNPIDEGELIDIFKE